MRYRVNVVCSVFLIFALAKVLATPQDDNTPPRPPPVGSKPPSFIAGLSNDDEDVTRSDKGGDDEESATIAPISEDTPPLAGDTATEAPVESSVKDPIPISISPSKVEVSKDDDNDDDDCGPACMLVNQTPIILLICILVVVLLLLVILFGCYFMKKLHGKAIFTSAQACKYTFCFRQRHDYLPRHKKNPENLKRGDTDSLPKKSGKTNDTTTTTASKMNGDQLNDTPLISEV